MSIKNDNKFIKQSWQINYTKMKLLSILNLIFIFTLVTAKPFETQDAVLKNFTSNEEKNDQNSLKTENPFYEEVFNDIFSEINGFGVEWLDQQQKLFKEKLFEILNMLDNLVQPGKNILDKIFSGHVDAETCKTCRDFVDYLKSFRTANEVKTSMKAFCRAYNISTRRTCDGFMDRFGDPFFYIVKNSNLTSDESCSVFLSLECMKFNKKNLTKNLKYTLELPPKKQEKQEISGLFDNKTSYTMLHLTDIHIDLEYAPGSSAECTEYICCRSDSKAKTNATAGLWGNSKGDCDIPKTLIEKTFEHISKEHNKEIDFIIWTGDTVPHDVWNTTVEKNIKSIKTVSDLIKKYFPNKKVFPSLGNHEAHPCNMFSPPQFDQKNLSSSWLYTDVLELWKNWIPTEEARKSFLFAGYYSTMVMPKLKLISLNSNFCYRLNFWNLLNPVNPGNQLTWLIEQLQDAEKRGILVMIISHIPPNKDCVEAWNHNYYRIINRFQHVIAGQYAGHTHKDQIGVIFSGKNSTPVGVSYMAPSLTTYTNLNPAYRLFSLDTMGRPIDYKTFYTNIAEDNKRGSKYSPNWTIEYSAKQAYGLKSLDTKTWADFLVRMEKDAQLLKKYYNHLHRFSDDYRAKHGDKQTNYKYLIEAGKFIDPFQQ